MPASIDNESEILLGNKQLLGVFAVVAILLAIAFTTGYVLGKNSVEKKAAAGTDSNQTATVAPEASGGPITQKVAPDDSQSSRPAPVETTPVEVPSPVDPPKAVAAAPKPAVKRQAAAPDGEQNVLGSHNSQGAPRAGENYVQVTAVARKVAEATADVLRQHGFAARIAPAPNNANIFRVLVGPSKDPADLRNTEDKLRKIGYTKCFIQHY